MKYDPKYKQDIESVQTDVKVLKETISKTQHWFKDKKSFVEVEQERANTRIGTVPQKRA